MDISSIIHVPSMPPSRHSNRRIRSFCGYQSSPSSSIGSSAGSSNLDSPLSPISPLQFYGVPFKWEEQPGIPKQYSPSPKDQIIKQSPWDPLPLPPAGPPQRFLSSVWKKKLYHETKLGKDPFMAALVVCSRPDEHWKGSRVSRTLSDRLGSCKSSNSCIVESTVLIPGSRRSSYEMLNRRL